MKRGMFCQLGSGAYAISVGKERWKRRLQDRLSGTRFAKTKGEPLPVTVYTHKSLIRRRLGQVDMQLQENKAINLSLAAPKVNGILIRSGEVFSFWKLVGSCTRAKGYREGLTISSGAPAKGIGGGLCQFTNLLHWMALHSPLDIVEHHHHNGLDLFPDFNRQVPFGCGTSVFYNYLDYRLQNNTDNTFQFMVYTDDTYLCGELRAAKPLPCSYHILEEGACFVKCDDGYYRQNTIYRQLIDKRTGNELKKQLMFTSHAKVMYSEEYIDQSKVITV